MHKNNYVKINIVNVWGNGKVKWKVTGFAQHKHFKYHLNYFESNPK